MSIAALLVVSLIAQLNQPPRDATTVCVIDARTRAPVVGAELTVRPTAAMLPQSSAPERRLESTCAVVRIARTDSVYVTRAASA